MYVLKNYGVASTCTLLNKATSLHILVLGGAMLIYMASQAKLVFLESVSKPTLASGSKSCV
jgi:hypothetical protein